MTENANTTEAPRCHVGSKSDNPCWREAVTKHSDDDRVALLLCEEHRLSIEAGRYAEDLQIDLDAIQRFLEKYAEELRQDEGDWGGGRIRDLLYNQREELEKEYLEALVKSEAARRVADRGPDEEPLELGEAERMMGQFIRDEALNNVLAVLEDLPNDALPPNLDRWAIAGVIGSIERHPDAEAEAIRQRLAAEARAARV